MDRLGNSYDSRFEGQEEAPCLLLNKKQMKKNRGTVSKDKAEKN